MDYIRLSHDRAYSQVSHVSSGQQWAPNKRLSSRLMSRQDTKRWAHPAEKARWATGTNSWFGLGLLPVELMSRRTILETGEFTQLQIYHANPIETAHYPNAFNWFGLEPSSEGVNLVSTVSDSLFFFSAAGLLVVIYQHSVFNEADQYTVKLLQYCSCGSSLQLKDKWC